MTDVCKCTLRKVIETFLMLNSEQVLFGVSSCGAKQSKQFAYIFLAAERLLWFVLVLIAFPCPNLTCQILYSLTILDTVKFPKSFKIKYIIELPYFVYVKSLPYYLNLYYTKLWSYLKSHILTYDPAATARWFLPLAQEIELMYFSPVSTLDPSLVHCQLPASLDCSNSNKWTVVW